MSTLREAADLARNLDKQFRAVMRVGEALREIADLELAGEEAKRKTEEHLAARDAAWRERTAALAAQARAVEVLAQIRHDNEVEVESARTQAAALVMDAKEDAEQIRQRAQEETDLTLAAAAKDEGAIRTRIADLTVEATLKKKAVESLEAELAALRAKFA